MLLLASRSDRAWRISQQTSQFGEVPYPYHSKPANQSHLRDVLLGNDHHRYAAPIKRIGGQQYATNLTQFALKPQLTEKTHVR